jgi:hypothetical protein
MFVRICLLSVLVLAGLAQPAMTDDGTPVRWDRVSGRSPAEQVQFLRLITRQLQTPPASPCRAYGRC